ncbi:MAG: M20 family metallopeptidase [Gammaproteobacteria bacterium]|nr:M20 family metallopeptidase [Gammaproteobacteria bacterium]
MSADARAVLTHLRAQRSAMLALLERLTELESPSSDAQSQEAVEDVIVEELRGIEYRVRRLPGRRTGGAIFSRPATRPRDVPLQLLVGHYDTVWPIGTLENMPFAVDQEVVRGPGVFDMKGGIVQILFSLRALQELELEPSVTPLILLNSDEEIGSRESARYIHRLAQLANRALVMEPSMGPEGTIKTTRKGVGRFTVTARGKAAHAGLDPEAGASAILELSHVIQKLFRLNDPARGISVNVGTIDGGIRPNVIAPESSAVIDVRVTTGADANRVQDAILAIEPETPGVALDIEGFIGRPPLERTPRNQVLWELARKLGRELDLDLTEGLAGGGSDGSTTSLYTATLDGLGPVGDGAHASHEHLLLDRTIERAALLSLLIMAPPLSELPA